MSEGKLRAWEEAGLVDAATAARIRQWEADHARPLALWAVIGIAALAIGLGVVSVVAANWEDIPGHVRLSIHFALMIGMAGFIAAKGWGLAGRQPWLQEASLFVLAMLGLTFLGHVGQVYQTTSPLWQPMALWLLLFVPLLVMEGLSWLSAALVMSALVFTVWSHVTDSDQGTPHSVTTIRSAFEIGLPVLVAGLAAMMRGRSRRVTFWRRMEQLALAYSVSGASLMAMLSAFEHWPDHSDAGQLLLGLTVLAAMAAATGFWVAKVQADAAGRATCGILLGCALVSFAFWTLSGSSAVAGLLFMALWAAIAGAAMYAGWRGVFQGAVAVIALRLIILSFELAGDLLSSGFGLIISGLLILAIAWAAMDVSKRFAPLKEDGA